MADPPISAFEMQRVVPLGRRRAERFSAAAGFFFSRTAFPARGGKSGGCARPRSGRRAAIAQGSAGVRALSSSSEGAGAGEDAAADVDRWPDGTPKAHQGATAWKNWINFDSRHDALTDRLNRRRHFFWEVDARGALWRVEVEGIDDTDEAAPRMDADCTERRTGQMREAKIVDDFFGRVRANDTGLYEDRFPFLVRRAHELYFCKATWMPAPACREEEEEEAEARGGDTESQPPATFFPIVFNNLEIDMRQSDEGEADADGHAESVENCEHTEPPQLVLRHSCPGTGHIVAAVDTLFDPAALRADGEGRLYHPVRAQRVVSASGKVKKNKGRGEGLALLEDKVVQMIAEGPTQFYADTTSGDAGGEGGIRFEEEGDGEEMSLVWRGGVHYPVRSV